MSTKLHTVIVTIFEGKSFNPLAIGSQVYLTCRFNNEILSTDPVPMNTTPIWDTELSWDLDGKTLSFLKSSRVALKLVCFAVSSSQQRTNLGYVMLDLRTAGKTFPPSEVWYPLVNTKHVATFRPSVKLAFAVLPKGTETVYPSLHDPEVNTAEINPVPIMDSAKASHSKSRPFHIDVQPDAFQIGGDATGSRDPFSLIIHICFTQHMDILLNSFSRENREIPAEFHFYFPFLEFPIHSTRFANIQTPVDEKLVIQFRASLKDLIAILRDMEHLSICICGGDEILGIFKIPIDNLELGQNEESIYRIFSPAEEEASYNTNDVRHPSVGVSLQLMNSDMVVEDGNTLFFPRSELTVQRPEVPVDSTSSFLHNDENSKNYFQAEKSSFREPDTFMNRSLKEMSPIVDKQQSSLQHSPLSRASRSPNGDVSVSMTSPSQSVGLHRFRYAIDIRQITKFSKPGSTVFFKYTYAPFGSISPFLTRPFAVPQLASNAFVPNSFCAFEFVMTMERLSMYLEAVPLVVEMVEKDPFLKDILLGTATVDLSTVFKSERNSSVKAKSSSNRPPVPCTIQSVKIPVQVNSADSGSDGLATIEVVLALEDFGGIKGKSAIIDKDAHQSTRANMSVYSNLNDGETIPLQVKADVSMGESPDQWVLGEQTMPNQDNATSGSLLNLHSNISASAEYQAVLELDAWKREQRALFKRHLEEQQTAHLACLSEEWKRREIQAERALSVKAEKADQARESANALLRDLQARDAALRKGETLLAQHQKELDRWKYLKEEEYTISLERIRSQSKLDLDLNQLKLADLSENRAKLLQEYKELEAKYKVVQDEFYAFKNTHPALQAHSQLKVELEQLKVDHAQTKREMERLGAAKSQYKAQLMSALAELSALKASEKFEAQKKFEEDYQQVQEMKRMMRAKAELEKVSAEQHELQSLRKELDTLSGIRPSSFYDPGSRDHIKGNSVLDDDFINLKSIPAASVKEIKRLESEKRSLLSDGYVDADLLIIDINSRIRQLML